MVTFGAQKRFVLSSCAIFSIGDRTPLWLPLVSFSPAPQLQAKFDVLLSDKVFLLATENMCSLCVLPSAVGKNGWPANGLIPHQQQLLWLCGSVPGVPWIAEGYLERPPLARSSWRLQGPHQQPICAIFLRTTSCCSVACKAILLVLAQVLSTEFMVCKVSDLRELILGGWLLTV